MLTHLRRICTEQDLSVYFDIDAALAAKMQYLSDTPAAVDALRDGTAEYICSRYSEEAVADATMTLYSTLLKKEVTAHEEYGM